MNRTQPGSNTFFIVAGIIAVLDQVTKYLVSEYITSPVNIIGNFLTLTVIHNVGAGFGILQGWRWFLIIVSFFTIGLVIYYHRKFSEKIVLYSLAFILGGALGNLIDRIIFGYVVDFINFSFWPAFNVADSAITIGCIGLLYYFIKN